MPPPWVSSELPKDTLWKEKDLEKLRDKQTIQNSSVAKTTTKTQQTSKETEKPKIDAVPIAYPMGDYRVDERGQKRKLEILMGVQPKIERQEILEADHVPSDRSLTEKEKWEKDRNVLQEKGKEASIISKKLDGSAWVDEDGYATTKEPPAFREGYNTTLRVKPAQNPDLHNGLKPLEIRPSVTLDDNISNKLLKNAAVHLPKQPERAQVKVKQVPTGIVEQAHAITRGTSDKVFEISKDPRAAELIGAFFMKAMMKGWGSIGPEKSKSNSHLIMNGLKLSKNDLELSRELGNAFINLGMTLPINLKSREESLRTDSVALEMGTKMMSLFGEGGKQQIKNGESPMRKEVAIALGRAFLHIQGAAGMELSRSMKTTQDKMMKDRTLRDVMGKLTLQLIESFSPTTLSRENLFVKDAARREILCKALGNLLLGLETSASRNLLVDKVLKEREEYFQKHDPSILADHQATAALKNALLDRIKKLDLKLSDRPLIAAEEKAPMPSKQNWVIEKPKMVSTNKNLERVGLWTGPEKFVKEKAITRLNKPSEIVNKRPILGGRDAPPSTIPRFIATSS